MAKAEAVAEADIVREGVKQIHSKFRRDMSDGVAHTNEEGLRGVSG